MRVPLRWRIFLNNLTLSQRFMLAALVILLAGMLGISRWVEQQIVAGVIHRTGVTTALYVDSFVAPKLQALGTASSPTPTGELSLEEQEALRMLFLDTPMGNQIVTLKIWTPQGKLLFTTDPDLQAGKYYPMHDGMLLARLGDVVSEVSTLDDEENKTLGEHFDQLLETYSPVWLSGTDQIIAVAEFYQRTDDLNLEIASILRQTRLVVGLTGLLIYLLLASFVRRASNTILNQQMELAARIKQLTQLLVQNQELSERVRRASASVARLNESYLRRVGAELHDGPAQDLGLSLLKLDALAGKIENQPTAPAHQAWVDEINQIEAALQNALKEVRGIAAGLSLPELTDLDLPETVARVVRAHERQTGTQVALDLAAGLPVVALPLKITVYRLVQEALNNAFRHAGGAGQRVCITVRGDQLVIEVSDSGPGFTGAPEQEGNIRLGLSGMRERVESLGGQFAAESQPGQGATIRALLPCHVGETQP